MRVRHIGYDLERKGLKDENIRTYLHNIPRATLFTLDEGYYDRQFCHASYCLIVLAVRDDEVARYVRRAPSSSVENLGRTGRRGGPPYGRRTHTLAPTCRTRGAVRLAMTRRPFDGRPADA